MLCAAALKLKVKRRGQAGWVREDRVDRDWERRRREGTERNTSISSQYVVVIASECVLRIVW